MSEQDQDFAQAWHSLARAWTPLMWIIGAVAIGLAVVAVAPL